jgi:hypothetical protein
MAQDLTVNIKTTSDVPQAMGRAEAATTGFGKQVADIGKKFGTSFKDIFLSFLGPMALIGAAIGFIGKMIEENQKKQQEANDAAIAGTNALMSAEDKYFANKANKEKKTQATIDEAKTQRETTTQQFLEKDPRGQAMLKELQFKSMSDPLNNQVAFNKQKAVQDQVQLLIAEDMKNDPAAAAEAEAAAVASANAAAQKESDDAAKAKGTTFKGPEGFSNVVGVGANPVIEAMTMQLEETRKQTALLEILANLGGGGVPIDFTKVEQTTMTT